jgi:hypothetical protein
MQDRLNTAARCENARTLAQLLGVEVESATRLLDVSVVVTFDPDDAAAALLGQQTTGLLRRTIREGGPTAHEDSVAAEVVIGSASPRTAARTLWANSVPGRAVIGRDRPPAAEWAQLHPALSLVSACYVTSAVLKLATADAIPYPSPDPLILELDRLGLPGRGASARPIDICRSYLAGAGAVGNGFLWALQYFDVRGRLDIVDFDVVTAENLQRQVWFTEEDVGETKAERLAERAWRAFPGVQIVPRVCRLQDLREKGPGPWLNRLIVGVDSPRARRALQDEIPGEVFDASTTGVSEIVLHHHKQPTEGACLSCIYAPGGAERAREREIARHFGVSIADVQKLQIDDQVARAIAARFPGQGLNPAALIGQSYDSLFKALCAQAALLSPEGAQVLAPFAFVSVLAGALLAVEFVRRCGEPAQDHFNYWTVSPWHPFLVGRQRREAPRPTCPFCSVPELRATATKLWQAGS